MRTTIKDKEDIERISDVLHEGYYAKKDMVYDKDKKIFRIDGWRYMWENEKRTGILHTRKWIRCRLELGSVQEFKIIEWEKLDSYEFYEMELTSDNQKIVIKNFIGIDIELTIDEIRGRFLDTGGPLKNIPKNL